MNEKIRQGDDGGRFDYQAVEVLQEWERFRVK